MVQGRVQSPGFAVSHFVYISGMHVGHFMYASVHFLNKDCVRTVYISCSPFTVCYAYAGGYDLYIIPRSIYDPGLHHKAEVSKDLDANQGVHLQEEVLLEKDFDNNSVIDSGVGKSTAITRTTFNTRGVHTRNLHINKVLLHMFV